MHKDCLGPLDRVSRLRAGGDASATAKGRGLRSSPPALLWSGVAAIPVEDASTGCVMSLRKNSLASSSATAIVASLGDALWLVGSCSCIESFSNAWVWATMQSWCVGPFAPRLMGPQDGLVSWLHEETSCGMTSHRRASETIGSTTPINSRPRCSEANWSTRVSSESASDRWGSTIEDGGSPLLRAASPGAEVPAPSSNKSYGPAINVEPLVVGVGASGPPLFCSPSTGHRRFAGALGRRTKPRLLSKGAVACPA